jgi:hypothetical protein
MDACEREMVAHLMTLLELVAREGVGVSFETSPETGSEEGGAFDSRNEIPHIRIYRDDPGSIGDPREELLTLAHEFGHAQSWKEGRDTTRLAERYNAYRAGQDLDDAERVEILDEECRAWKRASPCLAERGFSVLDFNAERDRHLQTYLVGLKLPPELLVERMVESEKPPADGRRRVLCSRCGGLSWELEVAPE